MNQHDHRAQNREAADPEEGARAVPKLVLVYIAILIVWGVGYYAWQIGKPLLGGDSRTPGCNCASGVQAGRQFKR